MTDIKVGKIVLRNYYLNFLFQWLSKPLRASERRQLGKFLAAVQPSLIAFEKERIELLEKYADRDEGGKFETNGGQYKFLKLPEEKKKELMAALTEIMNAEATIDLLPSSIGGVAIVKKILADCDAILDPMTEDGKRAVQAYDGICQAFDDYDAGNEDGDGKEKDSV